MRLFITLCLLLAYLPAYADTVYKKVMPDGTTIYSDQSIPDAEEIETPETQGIKLAPVRNTAEKRTPAKQKTASAYSGIQITQPSQNETIRDNAGIVSVQISTQPKLNIESGHKIQLKMDGSAVEKPASASQFKLTNVDRGTHTLEASIIDSQNNTLLTSGKITFHMRRHSVLFRQNQQQKKTP